MRKLALAIALLAAGCLSDIDDACLRYADAQERCAAELRDPGGDRATFVRDCVVALEKSEEDSSTVVPDFRAFVACFELRQCTDRTAAIEGWTACRSP